MKRGPRIKPHVVSVTIAPLALANFYAKMIELGQAVEDESRCIEQMGKTLISNEVDCLHVPAGDGGLS
jgi:hypothetical protein